MGRIALTSRFLILSKAAPKLIKSASQKQKQVRAR